MDLRVVKLVHDSRDALERFEAEATASNHSSVYVHLKALEDMEINEPAVLEDNIQDVIDERFLTRLIALAEKPLTFHGQDTLKLARRVHDAIVRLFLRVERAVMRCSGIAAGDASWRARSPPVR